MSPQCSHEINSRSEFQVLLRLEYRSAQDISKNPAADGRAYRATSVSAQKGNRAAHCSTGGQAPRVWRLACASDRCRGSGHRSVWEGRAAGVNSVKTDGTFSDVELTSNLPLVVKALVDPLLLDFDFFVPPATFYEEELQAIMTR